MKLLTKATVVMLLLLGVNNAMAEIDTTPVQGRDSFSLGFDIKQIFVTPSGNFRQLLDSNKAASAVYLAYRTQGSLGFELGYSWTDRRPKDFNANVGSVLFGTTATAASVHKAKIRIKDTYLDMFLHMRLSETVEGKLGIGVGYTREGIKILHNPNITSEPLTVQLNTLEGRTGITPRVTIGIQGLVTEKFGLRALATFQKYSNIKVAGTINKTNRQMYNNAYTITLGLYWNFYGREEFEPL